MIHELTANNAKQVRKKFPNAMIIRPLVNMQWLVFDRVEDAIDHPSRRTV